MILEEQITTVLLAVCERSFPDVAPIETDRPYVTWQQIGGQAHGYTEGTVPANRFGDYQFNVWDDTRAGAVQQMLAIEAALMQAGAFAARPLSAMVAGYDEDMNRYSARQDFEIFGAR